MRWPFAFVGPASLPVAAGPFRPAATARPTDALPVPERSMSPSEPVSVVPVSSPSAVSAAARGDALAFLLALLAALAAKAGWLPVLPW